MKNSALFASTSLRGTIGPMTAAERAAGRYLRAPDGHGGDGDGTGGGAGGGGGSGGTPAAVTIERSVSSLDAVPEPLRGFYRQNGDVFELDDPAELRRHLGNIKNENASLKGKNAQFNKLVEAGIDVDTALRLAQEESQRQTQQLEDKGAWDQLKAQMETNFQTERESWTGREKKLLGTIDRILVDDAARAALADPEVEGNPTLLLPLIRDRVKVAETDDGFALQVLTPDGAPMLNAQNQPASLKDLFLEMKGKTEYAGAFKGLNQSGGGAPTNGSGGGAPSGQKPRSQMTPVEKTTYIQKHGLEGYQKLPA